MKLQFFAVFFFTIGVTINAQNISVGSLDMIEDRLRNEQLLGKIDSLFSFTLRPLPQSLIHENKTYSDKELPRKFYITGLPMSLTQQYNSLAPMGWNDGAMIPAKGYQMLFSAGLYASYGPLSIKLKPEYVYAANPNFETFPLTESDDVRLVHVEYLNHHNILERFGNKNYQYLGWGQSNVSLAIKKISIGLSTENLWWGPGQRNSLIMSNNALGFLHFTLNTRKPIKTFLGSFEGQVISGKLQDSGFDFPEEEYIVDGVNNKWPKVEEWRYINGLSVNYQPKWIPGLFVGMNRVFQVYHNEMGNSFNDYFPVLSPFQKKNVKNEEEKNRDQIASLFLRWVLKESKAEVYIENGWNDHSSTLWDLFESPEHSRAYLVGFSKIFIIDSQKGSYLKFNFENTQMQQTADQLVRPAGAWYRHGKVRQGYTNESQVIGAGIGPGGNSQTLDFSLWNKEKVWGVQLERYAHNMDFYYDAYTDYNHKWVDLNFNAYTYHRFGNIGIQAKFNAALMRNYQWQLENNKLNMQVKISLEYYF
ncbi:capsule assembly Wzi family protein [Flavobacterium sp. M31R6]|uniref:capsule assembly Wzi family protein n=1 Tax=Flavobacterium sp. M31R6 TaxID=2739062 RepID=UPI0015699883|nr:capsule assembly Wzi family protein [Flavobacterium sp. M31R6]QKJ64815.1 hypothetical protein HQN62_17330 [Flavobacterium sp. M31R6]